MRNKDVTVSIGHWYSSDTRRKKKVSNGIKRLLKVLIAAVTKFFRSAIDHQNKGPIIKYQSSLQRPVVADVPLGVCISRALSIVN
ncbi:hypothetical protein AB4K20DRAFT_1925566 [Rhizopus microsporus]